MLNSKQRSYLKAEAAKMEAIVHIGKDGVSENIVKQADDALEKRELIKVKLQQNCPLEVKDTANYLAEKTNSDVVLCIGKKFILFRQKNKESQYTLPR